MAIAAQVTYRDARNGRLRTHGYMAFDDRSRFDDYLAGCGRNARGPVMVVWTTGEVEYFIPDPFAPGQSLKVLQAPLVL